MNKKLLAMAIGAALVVGPALVAQAEVKLYGHAHMSLDNVDRDVSTDSGEWFVSTNSSRFGIRATEDLGGGLKAAAQYEFLFAQDVGTSNPVTNRDNYVGLEGGFGALRLGNIDSATKDTGGIADLFYREQLGESRSILNCGATCGGLDGRVANGIHYLSPKIGGGLELKAQYGVEDSFTTDATTMALGARWTAGPLVVGASYMNIEDPTPPGPDQKGMRLGAKFDVGGGFTVAALWQSVSDIGNSSGADRDTIGLGASFKAGNNIFKAQFYEADELDNAANTGGDMVAIGWDHLFSKTTKGYVTYAKTGNDSATNTFVVGGNGHATVVTGNANGSDTSGFSFGMIVDF